jgi:putative ATP-dependent endonuclease of OLD family
VYLERLTLTNFQCFGPEATTITCGRNLTAFLGGNASGKTAACQALLRLFSVIPEQRQVRVDDFHVPDSENEAPQRRDLTIEAVFAFPELDEASSSGEAEGAAADLPGVPEFFAQMTADEQGTLKLRIVLQASWLAEGSINGTIEDSRRIVHSFEEDYGSDWIDLKPSDRNRIQMVYVPASRDGSQQVAAFLRGRLWRASQWSEPFQSHIGEAAAQLAEKFRDEAVVDAVTDAIAHRWQELHHLSSEQQPLFEPISSDVGVLVTNAEMMFEPSPTGRRRSAAELSDGQQSLLYIALTAATLDLEAAVARGEHDDKFDITDTFLPTLTLLALEEPENNLSPFFLSRVVQQLLTVTAAGRAQSIISSHSASVMSRIAPEQVRHFRLDPVTKTSRVRGILLPDAGTEEGKYLREAVKAYPELYFARFVVLGEGDSEEIVLPKLAAARGLHIDQSFVAIVPLGGRHTNHFWRLLTDLDIPHATLLDLDWGRAGGGEGRLRDACVRLQAIGVDPFDGSPEIAEFASVNDIKGLTQNQLVPWLKHLEKWNVFFSAPLDLDMLLLTEFRAAYVDHLESGATGPSKEGDPRDSVLGAPGVRPAVSYWDDKDDDLRWYRYLFAKGKPSTHLRALAHVDDLSTIGKAVSRLLDTVSEAIKQS